MPHEMAALQTSRGTPQAVILAAGRGQRLQQDAADVPKPLAPLLGLTLLERAVFSCQEAGITQCYIVLGYEEERIARYISELEGRSRITLQAVENPDWEAGNGTSAYAVRPYLDSWFFLMMCDHVFDPSILRSLLDAGRHTTACLLAIDRRTDQIFDLDDATKVQLQGGSISAIGKQLTAFNAIDTGLFLCRPSLFEALERAREEGDASLTGGMRQLIQARQLRAVDIGSRFWIDVDTSASHAYAERSLLSGLEVPR